MKRLSLNIILIQQIICLILICTTLTDSCVDKQTSSAPGADRDKEGLLHDYHQRRLDLLSKFKYVDPPSSESSITMDMTVEVVYFAFIHPQREDYLEMMQSQLESFKCNGLHARARMTHIQLSIDSKANDLSTVKNVLSETVDMIHTTMNMKKTRIEVFLENLFEYPGIRKVWDISQAIRTDDVARRTIIIYYHSKGMFYTHGYDKIGARLQFDVLYHHLTFDQWDRVLEMYHKQPDLNKVGCAPAKKGWIWFNFFYVRASYVKLRLQQPTRSKDRFYYEKWLGLVYLPSSTSEIWNSSATYAPKFWPQGIHKINFPNESYDESKHHRADRRHSFCDDCWSTCISKDEELGAYSDIFVDGTPYGDGRDFYRCRPQSL